MAGREWGVFILLEHDPVSQEKKMRTKIDGRNKEDKKKEKQQKDKWRWSAQAEYEFAELTLQSCAPFSRK